MSNVDPALLPADEALARVCRETFAWGTETVPLDRSAGRILAAPLLSDRPQPPFDRVMMDGVALDFAAYATGRRTFPVAGIQAAGAPPVALAARGTCVEIMTGAALPPGATTVVPYELLAAGTAADGQASFTLPENVVDGQHVHPLGSDLAAGAEVLPAGHRIDAAAVALLATCGQATVSVRRLPRTAVVSTGDELVDVAATPAPHQIRMSNVYQLQALLATAGIDASRHHLSDEPEALRLRLGELLDTHELVLLSGGVSRGRFDHVPEALAALGVHRLFHRVAQRPGKPLWVGRTARTMVFGLPGNPVSTLACARVYVGAWLRASLGLGEAPAHCCRLAEEVTFRPALTLFQLAASRTDATGVMWADPVYGRNSGDAASVLRADGFLVLPVGRERYPAGEAFDWLPFAGLL